MPRIRIDRITLDLRLQHRLDSKDEPGCANRERVQEYAAKIEAGTFHRQPVKLIQEGRTLWLWSGFHTLAAHVALGKSHIEAEVEEGTFTDARALSWSVKTGNTEHGAPYQSGDKKALLLDLLSDPEWAAKPLREVAIHTGITERWCGEVRRQLPERGISGSVPEITPETEPAPRRGPGRPPGPAPRRQQPPQQQESPEPEPAAPAPRAQGNGRQPAPAPQAPEEAPAADLVDGTGQAVPEGLRDIFATRSLHGIVTDLEELGQAIRATESWAVFVRRGEAHDALETLLSALEAGLPYAVCPACEGNGCERCRQAGYLPEHAYLDLRRQLELEESA
jgi:hypothetical protein